MLLLSSLCVVESTVANNPWNYPFSFFTVYKCTTAIAVCVPSVVFLPVIFVTDRIVCVHMLLLLLLICYQYSYILSSCHCCCCYSPTTNTLLVFFDVVVIFLCLTIAVTLNWIRLITIPPLTVAPLPLFLMYLYFIYNSPSIFDVVGGGVLLSLFP